MLGRFLEVALVTGDTGEEWQRLQRVGFEPAPTGDIWSHAYGVVACEGLAIGLHAKGEEPFSVVFVRPDVAALHRELVARGIKVERARLGSDVFNELTLRDPGGIALKVLEARSFSPPADLPARTLCGTFRWLSLPCRDPEAAMPFWFALGATCLAFHEPFPGFTIDATLACHSRRIFPGPLLVFDAPEQNASAGLVDVGFEISSPLALAEVPHVLASGPGELGLLLLNPV